MGKKITTEEFVRRAKEVHGDKYDYSKANYTSIRGKVEIVCKEHDSFMQSAQAHMNGHGCRKCGSEKIWKSRTRLNTEEFIRRAKITHGDTYDYSLSECSGYKQYVDIICKIHKKFSQRNDHHIGGAGCRKCANRYIPTTEEFIKKARGIHGDKYSYEKTEYKTAKDHVIISCKIHGDFLQKPDNHFHYGCSDCGKDLMAEKSRMKTDEFVKRATKIHKNKYNYKLTKIKRREDSVKIFCNKCERYFYQSWRAHLRGSGCRSCAFKNTSIELFIENFLKKYNITHRKNDRTLLCGMELDFYLPDYRLAIECDGIHWHSDFRGKDENYHLNKTNLCENKGIQLIHAFENEIKTQPNIVLSRLKSILGLNKYKIFARKCEVREILTKGKNRFLEKYHLQGTDRSSVKLGAFYKGKMISVMTFRKSQRGGVWGLSRFATISNFSIVGGAGKLLKYFERNWKPEKIISYADKRWSDGTLYKKLHFTKTKETKPSHWYFKGWRINLHHYSDFKKSTLHKKLDKFDLNMTELENMKANGWNRIWDCGNLIFEKEYN